MASDYYCISPAVTIAIWKMRRILKKFFLLACYTEKKAYVLLATSVSQWHLPLMGHRHGTPWRCLLHSVTVILHYCHWRHSSELCCQCQRQRDRKNRLLLPLSACSWCSCPTETVMLLYRVDKSSQTYLCITQSSVGNDSPRSAFRQIDLGDK